MVNVNNLVMDALMVYNKILGPLTLNYIKVVMALYVLVMKF